MLVGFDCRNGRVWRLLQPSSLERSAKTPLRLCWSQMRNRPGSWLAVSLEENFAYHESYGRFATRKEW